MDTERASPRYSDLDVWAPLDIVEAMIEGQFTAVAAVRAAVTFYSWRPERVAAVGGRRRGRGRSSCPAHPTTRNRLCRRGHRSRCERHHAVHLVLPNRSKATGRFDNWSCKQPRYANPERGRSCSPAGYRRRADCGIHQNESGNGAAYHPQRLLIFGHDLAGAGLRWTDGGPTGG